MLAIGRAMMSRPKLLMLDEPSMGLSPLMMQRIMSTIVELQSEGVTILLVEQNAQAALSLANYGYVLEVGKIVLENTGKALLVDENVPISARTERARAIALSLISLATKRLVQKGASTLDRSVVQCLHAN